MTESWRVGSTEGTAEKEDVSVGDAFAAGAADRDSLAESRSVRTRARSSVIRRMESVTLDTGFGGVASGSTTE